MKPTPTSRSTAQIAGEIVGHAEIPLTGNVTIVASRYHDDACRAMTLAAIATLKQAGLDEDAIRVIRVPGAWELPLGVQMALESGYDLAAVIAVGVVIRGETSHDEHINRAVSMELMRQSTDNLLPVGLALLTCNDADQVAARTGGEHGNKGAEAAEAVLEMIRLGECLNDQD